MHCRVTLFACFVASVSVEFISGRNQGLEISRTMLWMMAEGRCACAASKVKDQKVKKLKKKKKFRRIDMQA